MNLVMASISMKYIQLFMRYLEQCLVQLRDKKECYDTVSSIHGSDV